MTSRTLLERRERLAYLALYYAIQGDNERSEQVRRQVRRLEDRVLPDRELVAVPVQA